MKLFVSYARVDRPFCEQIVRTLETAHDVWFDRRLHAGKKWWDQIRSRLSWCEGFVYLLSPESIESEYCQKEYAIARDSGKLVFPVKIQSNAEVSEELLETQMVDFSDGLTPEAVALLMAGINIAEVEQTRYRVSRPPEDEIEAPVIETSEGSHAFATALDAYNAGRLDDALFKLMQVRESGYDPGRFVSLDNMIEEVRAALERQAYLREAERCYAPITHMVSVTAMRSQGCEAFAEFTQEFPDYDPQDIQGQCERHRRQQTRTTAQVKRRQTRASARPDWLNEPRAIIIGAVITGVLGLVGTAIATDGFGLGGSGTQQNPPTDVPTQQVAVVETQETVPEQPTDRPTDSPTGEPTPDSIDTPESVTPVGFIPVTRNADWEPVIEEKNGVRMALVPVGCFQMGSEDGGSDESPVHEVCFDEPFWIDVYEVTNEQYGEAASGCTDWSSDDNQPRICISWTDSLAHCESRGARLPTEAEWEYAARGPNELVYPWGNTFEADNVVYTENDPGGTAPVGSKPGGVSWVGAFDLSGNVWEWVNDWYDSGYYGTLADGVINPQGPDTGNARVLRGGSWFDSSFVVRAANRYGYIPSNGYGNLGFRCALSY
jgi:formylglycine-generating enzyme required for sulfatase activity